MENLEHVAIMGLAYCVALICVMAIGFTVAGINSKIGE